jgi:molybdopterin-guanine dinucleotide biosynthesis protein A
MGRNKAALRLGGRTLLGHVRAAAKQLGLPVRVIRQDLIPGCGPLGGVHTALTTSRAAGSLFLSCDMPFVSVELLRRALRHFSGGPPALFVRDEQGVGFPFLLRRDCLPVVERQLAGKRFSLQRLARTLRAKTLRPARGLVPDLFNVNTPADWQQARKLWRARSIHAGVIKSG